MRSFRDRPGGPKGNLHDDLLGSSLQVKGSLLGGGEDTGGLNNVVGTGGSPLDGSGVTLLEELDGLSVDDEVSVLGRDLSLEDSVGGVVLQHVDGVDGVNEGVVDGNDLNVLVLDGIAEDNTSDTSETAEEVVSIQVLRRWMKMETHLIPTLTTILNSEDVVSGVHDKGES